LEGIHFEEVEEVSTSFTRRMMRLSPESLGIHQFVIGLG